jgi:hypothetical protein
MDGTIISVSKTGFTLQTSKGPKEFKAADHLLKGKPSPAGKVYDLIYRVKFADLREGMEVYVDYLILGGDWVCKGIQPRPAEINFNNLAKVEGKYTLKLTLVAADGTKLEQSLDVEAGSSVEAVRNQVQRSLEPAPLPKDRWPVFAWGKNYLAVDGYIRGDKMIPIEKIEVHCPELNRTEQPLCRQKKQPWPR